MVAGDLQSGAERVAEKGHIFKLNSGKPANDPGQSHEGQMTA
jgi:hypothetical protein